MVVISTFDFDSRVSSATQSDILFSSLLSIVHMSASIDSPSLNTLMSVAGLTNFSHHMLHRIYELIRSFLNNPPPFATSKGCLFGHRNGFSTERDLTRDSLRPRSWVVPTHGKWLEIDHNQVLATS